MSQELLNIENLMRGMPSAPTAQFKLISPRKRKAEEEPKEGKTPSVADVNAALRAKKITSEEAYGLNSEAGFTPTRRDVKKALKDKKITKEEAYDLNKDYDKKPTPRASKNNPNPSPSPNPKPSPSPSPATDPNVAPKIGPGTSSIAPEPAAPAKNKATERKNEKGTKAPPAPTFDPNNLNNGFTGYTPRKTGTGGYDQALKSGAIDKETYDSYLEDAKNPGKDYMPKQISNTVDTLVKERDAARNAKVQGPSNAPDSNNPEASYEDVSEAVLKGHIAPYQGVDLSPAYGQKLAQNLMENNNRIMSMSPQFKAASNFVSPEDEPATKTPTSTKTTTPTNYVKPTITPAPISEEKLPRQFKQNG
jgi:hypothetical protein